MNIDLENALFIKSKVLCKSWRGEVEGIQHYFVWDELTYLDFYNSEYDIDAFLTYILNVEDSFITQYFTDDYINILETLLTNFTYENISIKLNAIKNKYIS